MRGKILDFIEDHRKLCIFLIVAVLMVGGVLGLRAYNMSRKAAQAALDAAAGGGTAQQEVPSAQAKLPEQKPEAPASQYQSTIKDRLEDKTGNIPEDWDKEEVEDPETEQPEVPQAITPNTDVSVKVFGSTVVPSKNMDGSSCKAYLSGVSLANFGTMWGTPLDDADRQSQARHFVGVRQDSVDEELADLQSVGWLISNLGNMAPNDAVKFTNLHVIGSLAQDHVALLCSYDWYSAFGLKDTLVVFEDMGGTLDAGSFADGAVFSATVFVHNIKVVEANGQRVVCVQYDVFK